MSSTGISTKHWSLCCCFKPEGKRNRVSSPSAVASSRSTEISALVRRLEVLEDKCSVIPALKQECERLSTQEKVYSDKLEQAQREICRLQTLEEKYKELFSRLQNEVRNAEICVTEAPKNESIELEDTVMTNCSKSLFDTLPKLNGLASNMVLKNLQLSTESETSRNHSGKNDVNQVTKVKRNTRPLINIQIITHNICETGAQTAAKQQTEALARDLVNILNDQPDVFKEFTDVEIVATHLSGAISRETKEERTLYIAFNLMSSKRIEESTYTLYSMIQDKPHKAIVQYITADGKNPDDDLGFINEKTGPKISAIFYTSGIDGKFRLDSHKKLAPCNQYAIKCIAEFVRRMLLKDG